MNRITELFGIKYPIIQGGMVWCSGWKLASAVSREGGLGLIGAGSMYPEILEEHIKKCKLSTNNPFGVNIPIMHKYSENNIEVIIKNGVKIVFTSAGNPSKFTKRLIDNGIVVVHVVSSVKFALKAEKCGVNAVVCEGFEAGGHNGVEETTTMCLTQDILSKVSIPVISAGGIFTGSSMLSALALGSEGVQIGSRFAACVESSASIKFKRMILSAKEGDTKLSLKKVMAVRLLKNNFFNKIEAAENRGASYDKLKSLLSKGKAKLGMFDGDIENGELEIGQISSMISEMQTVKEIMSEIIKEFNDSLYDVKNISFLDKLS